MSDLTLEELEGVRWEDPTFGSYLVTTCHRLRKKPINKFTIEDLRIVIGQNVGLPFLLPRAIAALEANPLVEGDYYPGDLLSAVLHADRAFLRQEPELLRRMMAVTRLAEMTLKAEADVESRSVEAKLLREIMQFTADEIP